MAKIQREDGVTAPGLGSFQKLDGGARGLRGLRLELAWGVGSTTQSRNAYMPTNEFSLNAVFMVPW